ncbi:hypothetical protein NC653_023957 [Populus alba x Populus x berolinensis]|uniref:Uncharacterized protein n=1 Tax=Populus alba x Populus x berolinensis TaxID=444605 RepID=A0AAD6MIZ5_9ROSI|nr:hypothetical protein NC653_023957 [Populus alba x Populus x berolinensis]
MCCYFSPALPIHSWSYTFIQFCNFRLFICILLKEEDNLEWPFQK